MSKDCNNEVSPESKECRCYCGQLMAIQTPRGIEIKCKRCKQVVILPLIDLKETTK